ncbi:MAG TPA: FGGY family carbohydrate kinase [Cyclobacteriaceae bacterium]|nr:FGGY family carbohydrate kinase [Cyclobacteriaceae bacterium]
MQGYLLGLDIGSSSVKATLVDVVTGTRATSAQSPAEEMEMITLNPGWAEQDPETWWHHVVICIKECLAKAGAAGDQVKAIGIAYQMHGLVCIDKAGNPVRSSIIWCDSRAVKIGEEAFAALGEDFCLKHFLNAPGNFTASKLKWVKENEPAVYDRIHKIMLPGDYIAFKLSGEATTTDTGLSEGIFWDYQEGTIATALLNQYGIDAGLLADIKPVFSIQAVINAKAAAQTGLKAGTPISYRAGDQPNNAFSLNVLNPGETAATAGTSGVIYSVTENNTFDKKSRVNAFLHVNNKANQKRNGILLCVNGTGILNSWLRKNIKSTEAISYNQMNELASGIRVGADGLQMLPFGNGAERILENKVINASWHGLDFNRHTQAHVFRAAQEGIVFALRYGFDILQSMGLQSQVIRAGHANMFLSPVFRHAFVNTTGARLELYDTDGAMGAALGAGVGAAIYSNFKQAFTGLKLLHNELPDSRQQEQYEMVYQKWKSILAQELTKL